MSRDSSEALSRDQAIAELTAPGQPYELVEIEQYGFQRKAFANAPRTLGDLYRQTSSDATFLVYENERYTFAETLSLSNRLANALLTEFGVTPGDRVAIAMRNYPEWVIGFMAATQIGAIAVAMNALWNGEELLYGLTDSGAKVWLADEERLARIAPHSHEVECASIAVRTDQLFSGTGSWTEVLQRSSAASPPSQNTEPDDDAIIFYTSGSTGYPKGVVSSHRAVLTALMSWELEAQINARLTGVVPEPPPGQLATLLGVPLFHATGSHAVLLACYRAQRKMVCMYKWDVEQACALIERERVVSFVAPAAMTGDLVNAARDTHYDLSSLRVVGGGGAPRAPEQVKRIASSIKSAMPNTGWGMTETNAIGTGIGGEDYLARPASSGRCSAVTQLRVVDEQGRELPAGERGELQICGTTLFRCYWNRPDATAEVLRAGWLSTGDVAYLDEEGYLFIVDRIKDLVIRGGENIGCGEVEAALLEHEAVLEAAVYGVPDERLGEEVGATVYCVRDLSPAELREFMGERVAKFKVPRYLQISSEPLPRIASGKLDKRTMRASAHENLTHA